MKHIFNPLNPQFPRVVFLLLGLFLTISISACGGDSDITVSQTGSITGIVVDSGGNPVAKALLQSSPPSSQIFSTLDGKYVLPDVLPGVYVVSAEKIGVGNGLANVNVIAGKTVTANIILSPAPITTGTISGKVTDSSGSGIMDAVITTAPVTDEITTDVQGNFVLTNIKAGSYTILAQKSGFIYASKQVLVTAGKVSNVSIRLDNLGAMPTKGLIAYFSFEGDGSDQSGNGHSMTIVGGKFVSSRKAGSQALLFDGVSTKAFVPHDPTLNPASITISCWVKLLKPNPQAGIGMSLLEKYIPNSSNGYTIFFNPDNIEWFFAGNTSSFTYCSSEFASFADNSWHSIILTCGASGTKMFYDGVSVASGAWNGTPSTPTQTNEFNFGWSQNASGKEVGARYNGAMDDVRIFDRVLSITEIQALANDR